MQTSRDLKMYQEIFQGCLKATSDHTFLKAIFGLGFTKTVVFLIQHSTMFRSIWFEEYTVLFRYDVWSTTLVLFMDTRYTPPRLLWFAMLIYNILTLTKISGILAILSSCLNPRKWQFLLYLRVIVSTLLLDSDVWKASLLPHHSGDSGTCPFLDKFNLICSLSFQTYITAFCQKIKKKGKVGIHWIL